MPFNFAEYKRTSRQQVHDTFAVPALYTDDANPAGVGVHVRWHNRLIRDGDLGAAGYSEVIEGVNRIVFGEVELTALALTPVQGGVVTIADYGGASFTLDTRDTTDGPVNVSWNVIQERPA